LLALCTLFSLTSCSVPELDLESAEESLRDEGYTVMYNENGEPGIEESLYANNGDDTLIVYICESRKMAKLMYQEFQLRLEYNIQSTELEIKSVKHILKRFEDDMSDDEIDRYEDQLDELEDELELYKKEYVLGKRGKTVWYGTKTAVEDSKG
jgi:transposase